MNKHFFPLTVCLMIGVLGTLVAYRPTSKPAPPHYNVLFIGTDDWKPVAGCYSDDGDVQIRTPNIDRLAGRGTVFWRNYCQQAVCAPTRASLLTGQRPDYTRVWDLQTQIRDMNPTILTMPQHFRQQGYVTAGIGKIFDYRSVDKSDDSLSWSLPYYRLGPSDYPAGFEPPYRAYQNPQTRRSIEHYVAEAATKGIAAGLPRQRYAQQRFSPFDESEDIPDGAYTDGAMARKAQRIIKQLADQNQPNRTGGPAARPFFLAVGFRSPHLPFVAPKKYWDLYDRSKLPTAAYQQKSKNPVDVAYQPSGELVDLYTGTQSEKFQKGFAPQPDSVQQRLIHGYYASVSYMDAQIGLLMDALKTNGLDKNTIVVLWGDHGWHLGDHGMWCKHTNFEQATRAPLIIAAPGFRAGQKTRSLTEFVDIFPTLCDLTGIKTPDALAGKSLVPILRKPTEQVKTYAVSQYPRDGDKVMGYAIRTDRYRYVAWFEHEFRKNRVMAGSKPKAVELYDYRKDPNETVNVANDKAFESVAGQHAQLLREFLQNQSQPMASTK
ncbi:MAG: sulfatase [Bacteroidetes bacterium]|nr:sulfatase [Fibrella sp.]